MAEDQPTVQAELVSPPTDPVTPHALKDQRESFGHKLGDVLASTASKTLLDNDITTLFKRDNPEASKESDDTRLKALGGQPFAAESQATSLRAQPFSPQAAGKIEGESIVKAIEKSTITIVSGLNALGGSLNSVVATQNITNSTLSKSNSMLNNLVGGINKSNLLLQNISDDVDKEKYEKPEFEKPNIGGGEREVGPKKVEGGEKEHTGPILEGLERIIGGAFGQVLANIGPQMLAIGGMMAGAFLGGLKAGLPAIIANITLGAASNVLNTTAKEKDVVGDHKSAALARILAAGNERAAQMAPAGIVAGGIVGGGLPGMAAGGILFGGVGEIEGMGEGIYNEFTRPNTPITPTQKIPSHHGRNRLGHRHHEKSWWDTFQREFGVAPAEAATEAGDPRQLGPSAVEKANPAVERTDKPDKPIVTQNVKLDGKGTSTNVDLNGDNVNVNINGESIARVLKETLKGAIAGGIAGSILPGFGTLSGAGVGAATGAYMGLHPDEVKKLKEGFEEKKKNSRKGVKKPSMICRPRAFEKIEKLFWIEAVSLDGPRN